MNFNPWLLAIFVVVIFTMLLIDLGLVNKKSHQISNKEALRWTLIWISLSMGFSALIWFQMGFAKFAEYQSAYWIEEALSVDNMFVFILVFKFFKLEGKLQHRVLFWGIIGALVFRGIFIFSGIGLIKLTYLPAFELFGYQFSLDQGAHAQPGFFFRPNLILTIFGAFLVYAGIKSLTESEDDDKKDFNKSLGARLLRKVFPVTKNYHDDHFFIKRGELDKVFIAVVPFQGPKFNGMPELHSLTPTLTILQKKGYKVGLVTDGRMSGASGKVPAAIHLTPEAYDGGLISKIQTGDIIRLDSEHGVIEVLNDAVVVKRATIQKDNSQFHFGRELFAKLRAGVSMSEEGASFII